MISNQVIQTSIDELKTITRIDLCVIDMEGITVATTFDNRNVSHELVRNFVDSPADSQIVGGVHMLKILEDGEVLYVLIAKGAGADAYMIGKVAVSQIQNLVIAYKEHFDKNNFFQNLLLDNLLLVDIYNRAKKLHIVPEAPRVVYLVEAQNDKDNISMEMLKNIFEGQPGCYLTAVEQKNIILIKEVGALDAYNEVEQTAQMIVDMLNSEAMLITKVSYGTIVSELKEVSKIPDDLDDEILTTVQKFFDNNLNVSETSRQLYVHRNTLVYRIEKLHQSTGLDIRKFDDALTFKIALMVVNYMKYIDSLE